MKGAIIHGSVRISRHSGRSGHIDMCESDAVDPCESQDWPQLDDRPVKGAFTGASNNRPGLLMSAHNGLLFLDEIGELGLDEQAMLLRAIEERRFLPVGADGESESKFQLLAGTNRDLQKAVAEGTFREDLLARIDLWTFRLPGLAERREDIEPNLDYELQ